MNLKRWLLSEEEDVNSPSILITDGGVSTHLEAKLQHKNQEFEHQSLWSSSLLMTEEGRKTIQEGHDDWLKSGSDIITTVTYQCHYGVPGLEMVVTPTQMDQMIQDGISIAKECVAKTNPRKLVVASTGCYGAALADGSEYTGNYGDMDRTGLVDFHLQKVKRMMAQKPDGVAIETVPSLEECHAIGEMLQSSKLTTLKENESQIACWVSLACQNGTQLNDGSKLWDALEALRSADDTTEAKYIHTIGINCCDSLHMPALLEIVTRHMATRGPKRGIVCYPNSGEEWDAANDSWKEGTGCSSAHELVERLVDAVHVIESTWKKHTAGAMPKLILGGCCRTSTQAICELRVAVDNWEQKQAKY
ncbi:unnamed protein product [Cylindrotheca closterium]|uniref:Hcy-binding domain-containing protein n=1 Tax=Cylindrotheca closterium TaxID=2856 RepID=A0AAD2CDH1_9STRA|nr:unnamed protein product [Cylindrotheca closterium]CAJ1930883.1 unnamed protein product [Cylindrotheca closterium]